MEKLDNRSRAVQTAKVEKSSGVLFSQVKRPIVRDILMNSLFRREFWPNSASNVQVRRFSYYAQQRVN